MSQSTTTCCPLCNEDVPATELHVLPPIDNLDAREQVLEALRDANPDWVAEDGACTRCWEEYARL